MRTFIALPVVPPPSLARVLWQLGQHRSSARPVAASNLHVTLKFLGDTSRAQLPDIRRAVDDAITGEVAAPARLVGLGAFPNAARPSVLWVGLQQADHLIRIATRLDSACDALGFAREPREFVPHLTLMRFKTRPADAVLELLESEPETDFGEIPVEQIVFYESDFLTGGKAHGPTYTQLSSHRLPAAD